MKTAAVFIVVGLLLASGLMPKVIKAVLAFVGWV
jgi:hypothetical protein